MNRSTHLLNSGSIAAVEPSYFFEVTAKPGCGCATGVVVLKPWCDGSLVNWRSLRVSSSHDLVQISLHDVAPCLCHFQDRDTPSSPSRGTPAAGRGRGGGVNTRRRRPRSHFPWMVAPASSCFTLSRVPSHARAALTFSRIVSCSAPSFTLQSVVFLNGRRLFLACRCASGQAADRTP